MGFGNNIRVTKFQRKKNANEQESRAFEFLVFPFWAQYSPPPLTGTYFLFSRVVGYAIKMFQNIRLEDSKHLVKSTPATPTPPPPTLITPTLLITTPTKT